MVAKAKAKAVAVWAMRFKPPDPATAPYGPLYMLYPFEPQPWRGDVPDKGAVWLSTEEFERLFPDCVLQPGGGPVRVR